MSLRMQIIYQGVFRRPDRSCRHQKPSASSLSLLLSQLPLSLRTNDMSSVSVHVDCCPTFKLSTFRVFIVFSIHQLHFGLSECRSVNLKKFQNSNTSNFEYENAGNKIRISWMRTARAQIPEFHATKMLFEYCCQVNFI